MDPTTEEASEEQLERARRQGRAYADALDLMVREVAQAGDKMAVGDYLVAYAIEEAEGMYRYSEGEFVWSAPGDENVHVEVAVCDVADGRFIPGLEVDVTLSAENGDEVGTHRHDLVWHPMMYHYARNWILPGDGAYSMKIEFEPPRFPRHDKVNGARFLQGVSVTFDGIEIETGRG